MIWVVTVKTDAYDIYTFAFEKRPDRAAIIERVWREEGEIEPLQWYLDACSVLMVQTELEP